MSNYTRLLSRGSGVDSPEDQSRSDQDGELWASRYCKLYKQDAAIGRIFFNTFMTVFVSNAIHVMILVLTAVRLTRAKAWLHLRL
jgi:ABC-type glycerol-3-phosphate transport system permease component